MKKLTQRTEKNQFIHQNNITKGVFMKSLVSGALALMLLVLPACGGKKKSTQPAAEPTQTEQAVGETKAEETAPTPATTDVNWGEEDLK